MKLPESFKSKISKVKRGEILPHLEITEVVLVQSNVGNIDYRQNSRVLYTFLINLLVNY